MDKKETATITEKGGSYIVSFPGGAKLRCHNSSTAKYYVRMWKKKKYVPSSTN